MPTWDFDTPGHVRLDLEIPFGRVELETATGETTHVSLEGNETYSRELIENARVESHQRGERSDVVVEVRSRGFMFSIGRSPEIRLRVVCPPDTDVSVRTKSADVTARGSYRAVEAKTASGDIEVDEVSGELRVKTASGDVAVHEVGGQTEIQSTSGDVALQRAGADVVAKLVSGDLWIRDAAASIHANTVSGDQRFEAVLDGTIEATAISGDVYVAVRRGSRVYVDANTVSGSTSSEFDLADSPQESSSGDENAPLVEVRAKTVSGDIMLARAPAPAQLPRA
jgi:putative adhesin